MPSWKVHEKYAILMGIPIEITRKINKLIDDPRWHDFFDSALERIEQPFLDGRLVIYNFDGSLLHTPTWEPLRKRIEAYGRDGFRAFFLHVFLDIIERNERGKGFRALQTNDISGLYKEYIEEVERFLQGRIDEVVRDVAEGIASRGRSGGVYAYIAASWLTKEPKLTLRRDWNGHTFIGPDDMTEAALSHFGVDVWYFRWCPVCRKGAPLGSLSPTELAEHLIIKERRGLSWPREFVKWFRKLARMMEKAEREGKRLKNGRLDESLKS
jgi:hypothetical protein